MLWMDLGTDSRFVEELAAGFDKVLRTGELDDLFVLPSGGGGAYGWCSSFCSISFASPNSGSSSSAFLQLLMALAVSPFN